MQAPLCRRVSLRCALVVALGGVAPLLAAEASPPLLLAQVYAEAVDPAAYWISEKLDGVRALWDGKALRHRSGRIVPAPAWYLTALPPEPLDGELWLGRGRFDALAAIVRKEAPVDAEWRQVRYMIFEAPGAPGDFSERIVRIRELVAAAAMPQLHAVEQFRVADREALRASLDAVVKVGGEGLMLHRADAPYLTGRSDVLLKLKPWQDAEGVVVGHLPGAGRNRGVLGALLVETAPGRRFRLGTGFTDALRRNPPPLGASVTYRYRGLTPAGAPRFASFLRVREGF